jgi:hypothetical protein
MDQLYLSVPILLLLGVAAAAAVASLAAVWPGAVALGPRAGGSTGRPSGLQLAQQGLTATVVGGCVLLVAARWVWQSQWQPVSAHVDGLLLMAGGLSAVLLISPRGSSWRRLGPVALPVVAGLLAWALCSSAWTYRPFVDTGWWHGLHRLGVYGGAAAAMAAGVGGVAYLLQDRMLRRGKEPRGRWPSLETLERLVRRATAVAAAGLGLGLATGLTLLPEQSGAGGRLLGLKIAVAVASWVLLLATATPAWAGLRGRRAAWAAIGGALLIAGVFGLALHGMSGEAAASVGGGG